MKQTRKQAHSQSGDGAHVQDGRRILVSPGQRLSAGLIVLHLDVFFLFRSGVSLELPVKSISLRESEVYAQIDLTLSASCTPADAERERERERERVREREREREREGERERAGEAR